MAGEVGDRIRTLREARGLKQAALARRLGVPPQTLSSYERGYHEPPAAVIPAIAEVLKVSYEELLGELPSNRGGAPSSRAARIRDRLLVRWGERLTEPELTLLDRLAGELVSYRARLLAGEHGRPMLTTEAGA